MTATQDPIAHAARLLREAAEELRQSHTLSSDRNNWIGEPDAKAAYDDHLAAAQALEDWEAAVGAGGVSGPLMGIATPPTAQAEGWRLVPVEPTQKMLFVAMNAFAAASASLGAFNAPDAAYRALLAAAPTLPTSAEGVEHG